MPEQITDQIAIGRKRTGLLAIIAVMSAVVLVACTDSPNPTPTATLAPPTATTANAHSDVLYTSKWMESVEQRPTMLQAVTVTLYRAPGRSSSAARVTAVARTTVGGTSTAGAGALPIGALWSVTMYLRVRRVCVCVCVCGKPLLALELTSPQPGSTHE